MIDFIKNLIPERYRLAATILVAVIALGGTAYYAYNKGLDQAQVVISEYKAEQSKLGEDLKEENIKINDKVTIKYVDRIKYIHDQKVVYRDVIVDRVPEQNDLSNGWIYVHNQVAQGLPIDPVLASDPTPSGIKDATALLTVNDNYSNCEVDREKLARLQESLTLWNEEVKKRKGDK